MVELLPTDTDLLGGLAGDISGLFRKEIQLAKAEVSEKVDHAVESSKRLAIGGVLAIGALFSFALLGVFLDVGIQAGVPLPLMGFALLFASSYFSTLTPQGGSQNVIFAASGYLTQRELYRLGLITTVFCTVMLYSMT